MTGPPAARLLIVNADDFGLSSAINEGIIEAHGRGIVTSTSLMTARPGAEGAARLARAHPALSMGLHFEQPPDVDLDDPAQAEAALHAQLDRFRELTEGLDPTHVDSHHHVHASGERMATFAKLTRPLGVPLRHDGRVAYIGDFWARTESGLTDLERVSRASLLRTIETQVRDGFTELACHPGRVTGDFVSSYLEERKAELQTLTERGLRAAIEALGVRLVSYHDWPG